LALLLKGIGLTLCCDSIAFSACTIKSRSSLLAPAYPGGPGKRAVKPLWSGMEISTTISADVAGEGPYLLTAVKKTKSGVCSWRNGVKMAAS